MSFSILILLTRKLLLLYKEKYPAYLSALKEFEIIFKNSKKLLLKL